VFEILRQPGAAPTADDDTDAGTADDPRLPSKSRDQQDRMTWWRYLSAHHMP
jgi:hypothetical protein